MKSLLIRFVKYKQNHTVSAWNEDILLNATGAVTLQQSLQSKKISISHNRLSIMALNVIWNRIKATG